MRHNTLGKRDIDGNVGALARNIPPMWCLLGEAFGEGTGPTPGPLDQGQPGLYCPLWSDHAVQDPQYPIEPHELSCGLGLVSHLAEIHNHLRTTGIHTFGGHRAMSPCTIVDWMYTKYCSSLWQTYPSNMVESAGRITPGYTPDEPFPERLPAPFPPLGIAEKPGFDTGQALDPHSRWLPWLRYTAYQTSLLIQEGMILVDEKVTLGADAPHHMVIGVKIAKALTYIPLLRNEQSGDSRTTLADLMATLIELCGPESPANTRDWFKIDRLSIRILLILHRDVGVTPMTPWGICHFLGWMIREGYSQPQDIPWGIDFQSTEYRDDPSWETGESLRTRREYDVRRRSYDIEIKTLQLNVPGAIAREVAIVNTDHMHYEFQEYKQIHWRNPYVNAVGTRDAYIQIGFHHQ